jgi:nitroreductase
MSQDRLTEHSIDPIFTRRWSPRAFNGEPIPEVTLLSFIEAARWAPSSYNSQPWRFIYGRAGTPGWQPIFESLGEFNRAWAHRASALVLVFSRTDWVQPGKTEAEALVSHSFDAGAAWASLALQATFSGWHAHGIGGFDRERARQALSIPADHAIEAVIAIGRKGDKGVLSGALQAREAPTQRLALSQLVADGRFAFGV